MPCCKGLEIRLDVMTMNALMADAHEGITAFLDKREPHWAGA